VKCRVFLPPLGWEVYCSSSETAGRAFKKAEKGVLEEAVSYT